MEYAAFALIAINLILLVVCLIMLKKIIGSKDDGGNEEIKTSLAVISKQVEGQRSFLSDESERSRREQSAFQKDLRSEMNESLNVMAEKLDKMNISNYEYQQRMTEELNRSLNSIRNSNLDAMTRMQESNEKKLDQMRETVDEKLNATLSDRLTSSFKTVSEQLENVNKSLGEMKELSSGVTDNVSSLNRVLTNVKARGTWAEIQLGNILDQTIPSMYVRNYSPDPFSRDVVEFAVRIPSTEGGGHDVYLPIDSKFPMEDYVRFNSAVDSGNQDNINAARKSLESSVLSAAKAITKYINVPSTTPFAIMYLATEGLYAEIASSRSGLPERLQNELNIMIAGPTTITALLNSLSMGFRAVAINEKANEVRKLLAAARQQYAKFGDVLQKARKKIDDAGKALDEAQDRNRIINNKLKSVSEIDRNESDEILGIQSGDSEE
ncbi:MAG: DNA recombination protein RmuC [Clostridiales bacterium]|nr:DNA recombination protein RmuC [Clostridiales bacterium]